MAETDHVRRTNSVDSHVGGRVRMRRLLIGMSQEKLAHGLGLTFQQVQKYEKGSNRIGASRLFELARILGVNIQYFFEELSEPDNCNAFGIPSFPESAGDDYLVEFLRSREGIKLNCGFLSIDNLKARRAILELVCSLADVQN